MYTLSDFDYTLPLELITSTPSKQRDHSKLLVVNPNQQILDKEFYNLIDFINPGDLVIFNDSKVIKARIFGQKLSGGKIEVLFEKMLSTNTFLAHVRSNKTIKPGLIIELKGGCPIKVVNLASGMFELEIFNLNYAQNFLSYLDQFGTIPLPPYMHRPSNEQDNTRYQTVYAKNLGSVAAPTAGLHFTLELLNQLKTNRVNLGYITLHIGSGTFKPVATENISEHKMHGETYQISVELYEKILATKTSGNKIIAVGTTSLRCLESFAHNNYAIGEHSTNIFITPGYKFQIVDKLITNFHLPKSTLLMLVAAFSGLEAILHAYKHAVDNKYHFFSYGDAMLLNFRQQDLVK